MSKNELIVQNDLTGILGNGIDFSTLNNSIIQMSKVDSSSMDNSQREFAIGIIDDWKWNVINKLSSYKDRVDVFISFFDPESSSPDNLEVDEEMRLQIANATGNGQIYKKYESAKADYENMKLIKPEYVLNEETMTVVEAAVAKGDYDAKIKSYNIRLGRIKRDYENSHKELVKALVATDEVKELIKRSKTYKRNFNKFVTQCKDKSLTAKTNIMISNANMRDALQGLVNFAIEL